MIGVTLMLETFGDMTAGDVFIDVGGGIGNVVFQVALQSRVQKCISLEARSDITTLAQKILDDNWINDLRLDKVSLVNVDITKADVCLITGVQDATHLFSHNTLFTEETLQALYEMCWLPNLRIVAVTVDACPRHRPTCSNTFCQLWSLHTIVKVPVTYRHRAINLYVYTKSKQVTL